DPSVAAVPPLALPRSRHFENGGLAILRTGWDESDAVVSLACGPLAGRRCAKRMRAGDPRSPSNFTHAHAGYNSITLFAKGRYFLIPPGYARRSSHFQNGIAVNGADLLARPDLDRRVRTVVEERDFVYAVGDGASGFPDRLGV